MDEYLSEKEQLERIRQWWSDNGWYLIGGVVIGLLGIFGYTQYRELQTARAEEAADRYQQMVAAVADDNAAGLNALLSSLREDHPNSPYTDHGGLLVAKHYLVSEPERAIEELRTVMNTSSEEEIETIARLRLARVLEYQGRHDEALQLLVVQTPGRYAAKIGEIRGDIYLAQGDEDEALIAYTTALAAEGADLIDRNFIQMKLASLAEPAVPQAAAEPAPAIEEIPEVEASAQVEATEEATSGDSGEEAE